MSNNSQQKNSSMEWQFGELELGNITRGSWNNPFQMEDPNSLFWYGPDGETHRVSDLAGASNWLLGDRFQEATAHILRTTKGRSRARVTCFVEFDTHYVTSAQDEHECREILDCAGHGFDPNKTVLCRRGSDDHCISVLPVEANDPIWIATAYRLKTLPLDRELYTTDRAFRWRVRSACKKNQSVRNAFVHEPYRYSENAIPYALVRSDGKISSSLDGCRFSGLVATPSGRVSHRLSRQLDATFD